MCLLSNKSHLIFGRLKIKGQVNRSTVKLEIYASRKQSEFSELQGYCSCYVRSPIPFELDVDLADFSYESPFV